MRANRIDKVGADLLGEQFAVDATYEVVIGPLRQSVQARIRELRETVAYHGDLIDALARPEIERFLELRAEHGDKVVFDHVAFWYVTRAMELAKGPA